MAKAKDKRQGATAGMPGAADDEKQTAAGQPERVAAPADAGPARLKKKVYRRELAGLQVEMFKLQAWITGRDRPVIVILEGLGPAGKAATAVGIANALHPRLAQVVRFDPPSKRERQQWHFQRYVEQLPAAGKLVIFDGSWYHYPAIEAALGLSSTADFGRFLDECVAFEKTLTTSGVTLVKYWLAAGDEEQDRRFREHMAELIKRKLYQLPAAAPANPPVPVADLAAAIIEGTGRPEAAWYRVIADDKRRGRLNLMAHLLALATAEPGPEPALAGEASLPVGQTVPEVF